MSDKQNGERDSLRTDSDVEDSKKPEVGNGHFDQLILNEENYKKPTNAEV